MLEFFVFTGIENRNFCITVSSLNLIYFEVICALLTARVQEVLVRIEEYGTLLGAVFADDRHVK